MVFTPSKPSTWSKKLPDKESRLGRTLAGGHLPSVAKAIVGHGELCELVFLLLLDKIDSECNSLCLRSAVPPSLFRKIPVTQLGEVKWKTCVDELRAKAPLLLQILQKIACHSDHRNVKNVNTAHYPGICMAAAIILKERNREMCGMQSLISLLLFASCLDKQVGCCMYMTYVACGDDLYLFHVS